MRTGSVVGNCIKVLLALAVLAAAAAAIAWRFWPESKLGKSVDTPMSLIDAKVREWTDKAEAPADAEEAKPAETAPANPKASAAGAEEGAPTERPAEAKRDDASAPNAETAKQPEASEKDSVWEGLVEANRIQGQKQTAKSLQGKVVLVCEFANDQPQSVAILPRVQQIWQSFKGKPFMTLGSLRPSEADAGKKSVRDVAFPVYRSLRHENARRMRDLPLFYVVSPDGKIVWSGRSDLEATEAVVEAIGATFSGGLGGTKKTPDLKSTGLQNMKQANQKSKTGKGGTLKGPTRR